LLKAKDMTFKAKDSKFVLEDISRPRPRTTTLLILYVLPLVTGAAIALNFKSYLTVLFTCNNFV